MTTLHVMTDDLIAAIKTISPAVDARLPILATARLFSSGDGRLRVTGYNLETGIVADIACNGAIDTALPMSALKKLSKLFAKDARLDITVEACEATLSQSGRKLKVRGSDGADYPRMPQRSAPPVCVMPVRSLITALEFVLPATTHEDNRPILRGVLFEAASNSAQVTGADGFRLHACSIPGAETSEPFSVIVSRDALSRWLKSLNAKGGDVSLYRLDKWVVATQDNVTFFGQTTEGTFPDYRSILADAKRGRETITILPGELKNALEGCMAVQMGAVTIIPSQETVTLKATSPDMGVYEVRVKCEATPDAPKMALQPRFLLQLCNLLARQRGRKGDRWGLDVARLTLGVDQANGDNPFATAPVLVTAAPFDDRGFNPAAVLMPLSVARSNP